MNEPIDNSEQLPIAYCEDLDLFGMNVASQLLGLNSTDKEFLETPLYTHPMRELSDEEILDAMCLNDTDLMVILEQTPYAKEKMIQRGRALLKKASEK